MKRKELKELARKIAKEEYIIQTSKDAAAVKGAQQSILMLSSHVEKIEDISIIDEYVQDMLAEML